VRAWLFTAAVLALQLSATAVEAQCMVDGDPCDDMLFCTEGDTCDAMLACVGTPRDCGDGDACTSDMCDEGMGVCVNPPAPMGTSCGDGDYCTVNDECDGAGSCMAGSARDCSDGLSCTSDTCDEGNDECDSVLNSSNCLIFGSCRSSGAQRSSNPCEICDPSNSQSEWSAGPAGLTCGSSTCDMGVETTPTCDDMGACEPVASPCPYDVCHDETFCATCGLDDHCPDATYCRATECVLAAPNGSVCDRGRRCLSGHCVDGICCDTECSGACESCAYLASPGTCTPHPAGTDPEDVCGMNICDGRGNCATDAGLPTTDGQVTVHGSGCIACAVGAPSRDARDVAPVLVLTLLLSFLRLRRRV